MEPRIQDLALADGLAPEIADFIVSFASTAPLCSRFAPPRCHHVLFLEAIEGAMKDFVRFTGITRPDEFRVVTRAHVIAWRDELARRGLGGGTVRHRRLSTRS